MAGSDPHDSAKPEAHDDAFATNYGAAPADPCTNGIPTEAPDEFATRYSDVPADPDATGYTPTSSQRTARSRRSWRDDWCARPPRPCSTRMPTASSTAI